MKSFSIKNRNLSLSRRELIQLKNCEQSYIRRRTIFNLTHPLCGASWIQNGNKGGI
ncbi:unnamed protein product [Acanthoscelides obtectus]|uniref:Uncharacterized protein n=1 Tax=Acanthoscelides obtectus TaxID=200917 RepID=A0A9P0PC30_ACAOB|nr:unnamed protein product [Acanthoscelides obtectus]CAK1655691.1 hypothetical protein AOBTE_LOCUS19264 [Acanthoscelides obtectus]